MLLGAKNVAIVGKEDQYEMMLVTHNKLGRVFVPFSYVLQNSVLFITNYLGSDFFSLLRVKGAAL